MTQAKGPLTISAKPCPDHGKGPQGSEVKHEASQGTSLPAQQGAQVPRAGGGCLDKLEQGAWVALGCSADRAL